MMEQSITYFDTPGKHNTDEVVAIVARTVRERGIRHVVVATTSGSTALRLSEALKGTDVRIVAVTLKYGFREEGKRPMSEECAAELERRGITLITQSHALSGVERSFSSELGGASRSEVLAAALKSLFGVGFKVAVEVTLMAADTGAIPVGDDVEVVAMGGTHGGADVACIMRPAHTNHFFKMQIREILCMPRHK
ncbi:pyruvate kinase alpha/beta domain-containing protein [Methermicoccus shengliensis]|nr:pyruvate kinase alpha/beta domain-containing protein [Methermicoccus shengliensis]KUK04492.1 MAG: DUF1867-containing protein [Euryarchaeota archaeon 55_53]KUK29786.1 MAG: DUF1867-containing protein [Methanosarcinales archeaon 56_1174]MDI3487465.1 uncharacterized protein [Methanosarcinales archaeon]